MLPKNRPPTTPGEILREEFLAPLEMTQGDLAERLSVKTETINRLINGKSAVSVGMALRLSKAFGTTPEFWLNLQQNHDVWHDLREMSVDLRAIKRVKGVEDIPIGKMV